MGEGADGLIFVGVNKVAEELSTFADDVGGWEWVDGIVLRAMKASAGRTGLFANWTKIGASR